MKEIAILIPCCNEGGTIAKVVKDFQDAFSEYGGAENIAIYVYDNNSIDDTAIEAKKAGAVVRNEYRQGKGNVVRRMFREIDADCYVLVDGDDTYPAENAPEMVDFVLDGWADMVVGDRLSSTYFSENKRRFHSFGNVFVRKVINLFFDCDIRDIMTGYRVFSRQFVKSFPILSKGFEIETEMSIHAIDKNMNIQNVVIDYRNRPKGDEGSKLNTYSDGIKVIGTILKMLRNYKPMLFFGCISCLLAVLAIVNFIPVWNEFISIGYVKKLPTLMVCGFSVMASIQSFFAGLILENLCAKDRRDFELYIIDHFEGKSMKENNE